MKKINMMIFKSWKTTLAGIVIAVLTALKFYQIITIEQFVTLMGIAGTLLGFSAKDGDKSGINSLLEVPKEEPKKGGDGTPTPTPNPLTDNTTKKK